MDDETRAEQPALSESVQMYLVALARLREEDGEPVPLSRLAKELDLSAPSVHEMCRKLQEQGLIVYEPYKGVTFTEEGSRRALYILRRHRLWEVLLVDRLGLTYDDAHDMSCQLEHATTDVLADRLDVYLGHPTVNPVGQTIPRSDGTVQECPAVRLSGLAVGRLGHILRLGDGPGAEFLAEHGLRPGKTVRVLAASDKALLVSAGGERLTLSIDLADKVWLRAEVPPEGEALV